MIEELRIAELLCTRLCHDLTGPIGAVNNGAEFLSEEGFNLQSQAVELITSSAFSAVSRLQFFRVAYGRVKEHGEASLADHQKLALDFFVGSKVNLNWPEQYADASGVSLSLRMVRLLFNLMIIGSSALLKGGDIDVTIQQESDGAKVMGLTVRGDAIKWDGEVEQIMQSPVDIGQISPKNVQLYVTRKLAEELNTRLTFTATANSISISAHRPPQSGAPDAA